MTVHPFALLPDELRLRDLEARDETRGELVPTSTADESGLDALNNLREAAPSVASRQPAASAGQPRSGPRGNCTTTGDPVEPRGEPSEFQTHMARAFLELEAAKKCAPTVLLTAQTAAVASRIGPGALARDVRHLMDDGAEYEPLQPDGAA